MDKIVTVETPWTGEEFPEVERRVAYSCCTCGEILTSEQAEKGWCPSCGKYGWIHRFDLDKPVNINRAHWKEISLVTGLGKTRSMKIVIHRREHGMYRDITDLLNIKGFGNVLYERIKDKVRV